MLKILYLVPNLADAAVERRVRMFRLGGADVEVGGFRRADAPVPSLPVGKAIEFDRTHDGRFAQRLAATLRVCAGAPQWRREFSRPDVIVARSLEMLALGNRLMALWPETPALVYECLDIHRLMLREDAVGKAMRAAEQGLSRRAAALITSSPAFLANYFEVHGAPPAMLVENKVLAGGTARGVNPALVPGANQPMRIGWFGALRCSKSLAALDGLTRAMDGRVEAVLRGRPALTEFGDFHGAVDASPYLRFGGPYRNPDDLAAIYSDVHFAWAIDFFEEGKNSQWLLPNRIYEGCLHGAIPVALAGTETAAFIERHGIGVIIPDIAPATLRDLFEAMTPERIRVLAAAVAACDPAAFRCGEAECRQLVNRLATLSAVRTAPVEVAA